MKTKIIIIFRERFLLFFSLYFCAIFLKSTSFIVDYPFLNLLEKVVRVLSLLLMIIRIIVIIYDNFNNIKKFLFDKKNIFSVFLLLIACAAVAINFLTCGGIKIISLIIICCASYGVDYNKIIKRMLYLQSILLVITVLGSVTCLTQDYTIYRDSVNLRHSMGFTYPTVLSQIILFISLIYFYQNDYKINIKEFAFFQILNILVYLLTDSRTEILFFELAIGFIAINRKFDIMGWIFKHIKLAIVVFLILPFFSFVMVLCYPLGGIMNKIDSALSGRLMIQNDVFCKEKISLFGTNIEMIGFGLEDATKFGDRVARDYNYIDNEYMQVLMMNGIVIFLLMLFIIMCSLIFLYKNGKKKEFVLVYFYLLFATINPRLLDVIYSPVPLIIAYEIFDSLKIKKGSDSHKKAKKRLN